MRLKNAAIAERRAYTDRGRIQPLQQRHRHRDQQADAHNQHPPEHEQPHRGLLRAEV